MARDITLSVPQLQALLDAPPSSARIPPVSAELQSLLPAVTFATTNVPPPAPHYLSPDDVLRVSVNNGVVGTTIEFTGRFLKPTGEFGPFRYSFTPTSDRVESVFDLILGEGFLLSAQIGITGGAVRPGGCFARIAAVGSPAAGAFFTTIFAQGYLGNGSLIFWPYGRQQTYGEGPGMLRTITGTTPAAGAEILETVPTNVRWRLRSVNATLVTSAAVATRAARFVIDTGGNVLINAPASVTQLAGLTNAYTACGWASIPQTIANVQGWFLPPDVMLRSGDRFRTSTTALQAGDQWQTIFYQVEEWVEL